MKAINDRYGHAVGDDVLRRVAVALTESTREADLIARIGGDEFVVLTVSPRRDDTAARRLAVGIAERLAAASDHEPRVSVSVGTQWMQPGTPLEDALQQADEAMYRRKRSR